MKKELWLVGLELEGYTRDFWRKAAVEMRWIILA